MNNFYQGDIDWARNFIQQEHQLDRMELKLDGEVNDEFCDLTESLHEQWWEMDAGTKNMVKRLRGVIN